MAQRTITLTSHRPVRIDEDRWNVIAISDRKDWDNQDEFQANRKARLTYRVRQHEDGRMIASVVASYETAFQGEHDGAYRGGYMLAAGEDPVPVIERLAQEVIDSGVELMSIDPRRVAANCIADLPAEEV